MNGALIRERAPGRILGRHEDFAGCDMAGSNPAPGSAPRTGLALLSNGRYHVAIAAAGTGRSRWDALALTRWREDPVCDPWGSYLLLRDEADGDVWSAGAQPFPDTGDSLQAGRDAASVRFQRRHRGIDCALDLLVDGERDAEVRRLRVTNHRAVATELSVTSFCELVLGPDGADAAHPAFSKLFVQTEWLEDGQALLATRRRRAPGEAGIWYGHFVDVDAGAAWMDGFESDRGVFLGRGRELREAQAMAPGARLSSTTGCVLDPISSLRWRLRLAPGEQSTLTFWTAAAGSRDELLALLASLRGVGAFERARAAAQARAERECARLGASERDCTRWQAAAAALLQVDPAARARPDEIARGKGGAPVLWSAGISGDRPLLLLRAGADARAETVDAVFRAQRHWQAQGLAADVVLLREADADEDFAHRVVEQQAALEADGAASGVFALGEASIDDGLRAGLATVARMVIDAAADWPPHDEAFPTPVPAPLGARLVNAGGATVEPACATESREFDNGYGGFVDGGRGYEITLPHGGCTPAPWINVIANAEFGCMLSAEGGGYSWSGNSQQNALTPWPNDPVSDAPRDVLYLRDLDSGEVWTVAAMPIRTEGARYRIVHGKGYSEFHAHCHDIEARLTVTVPVDASVKISRLQLHNAGARPRRLSVTAYVQWALGANGSATAPFVVTSVDAGTGALLARNRWRPEFNENVVFLDLGGAQHSHSGDRLEFLGRHGDLRSPAALRGDAALSGRVGAAFDPCGALQTQVDLAPGQRLELRVLLGEAPDEAQATAMVARWRAAAFEAVLGQVRAQWQQLLDVVQVRTPDRAMDILLNDWLLYQVLGCRLWARTAYYQSSGAYGFRDQLQDVASLCLARPDLVREHLLRAAGRQFPEGDVQHWWLPPGGTGVRTHVSDDLLWLPWAIAHYIAVCGDVAVLDEVLPFIAGDAVPAGRDDAFFRPEVSGLHGSLFEHAARTIDRSLAVGTHGLPLMGSGDWNDGMNAVGAAGRGESVWLAWFLITVIEAFAPHAESRGDRARADAWRAHAAALARTLDGPDGWDGAWYRRGYYDDGHPLGSAGSDACRIDAIAQSWSLISGAADAGKAAHCMESLREWLTDTQNKIALLFTPPFDHGADEPGYIKGYPPGIRENGGQYTHGATWSIFAWARLGRGDRAAAMFDILNPIRHSGSTEAARRYRVEPYVACADVYSVPPHVGRGGWTWYTGSAGWLYRAGIEAILGFRRHDTHVRLSPCIPADWPGFEMRYRHSGQHPSQTLHTFRIENPDAVERGVVRAQVDGREISPAADGSVELPLFDDGHEHVFVIRLGATAPPLR
jgi:cyclic beta-1,2-glucan synthetase